MVALDKQFDHHHGTKPRSSGRWRDESWQAGKTPGRRTADILSARSPRDTSSSSNISCANDIIYCGYRFDSESQLYYVRNRTYNPVLGRWIQRDPIGYAGGINLYEYVGGSVAGTADWVGLCPPGFRPMSPARLVAYARAHGGAYRGRRETEVNLAKEYPESGLSRGHILFRGLPAETRVHPIGHCEFVGLCVRISASFLLKDSHSTTYGRWRAVDSFNPQATNATVVEYARRVYLRYHYGRKVDVLRSYMCVSVCDPNARQPNFEPYMRYVYGGSMVVRSARADRIVRGLNQVRTGHGFEGGPAGNVLPLPAGGAPHAIPGEPPEPPGPGENTE